MSESNREKLERVEMMARGDSTWDMSDNDIAALRHVLSENARLSSQNERYNEMAGGDADELARLRSELSASQERECVMREALNKYADARNWQLTTIVNTDSTDHPTVAGLWGGDGKYPPQHGFAVAREALATPAPPCPHQQRVEELAADLDRMATEFQRCVDDRAERLNEPTASVRESFYDGAKEQSSRDARMAAEGAAAELERCVQEEAECLFINEFGDSTSAVRCSALKERAAELRKGKEPQ